MARNDLQLNLRVPTELKQKIEDATKESGRSINAEGVYRLEQSFENQKTMQQNLELAVNLVNEQKQQIDQLQSIIKQITAR